MGGERERGELREEVKGRGEENGGEKRGERGERGRPHSRTFPYLPVLCNKEVVLKKLGPINNFYASYIPAIQKM